MIVEDILKTEDLNALYMEKVNLTNKIGSLHRQVATSYTDADRSDYKAELTTSYAIMEALNHQLDVMEDKAKQTRDEEGRIRYNFMKIAKTILTKETYDKIRNMSDNSLRDMKPMFKELRQNKVNS